MMYSVDYHVTDVCNLNCAHCSHFCSIVPKTTKHKSIEQITADFALMSKFRDNFLYLGLMGGEAFLHPQLSKILRIARDFFPNNKISITTNGTLADKILQWKDAIEENDIKIVVTIYPYKKDMWENYWKIKQVVPNTASWIFPAEIGMTYKELSRVPNIATPEEIIHCFKRQRCNQLKDGKLWICHYAAQLNRLKDAFPNDVPFDQDDKCYIDLNNDDLTWEDIENWQRTTWPEICNYCLDVHYGGYSGPVEDWRTSTGDVSEWIE